MKKVPTAEALAEQFSQTINDWFDADTIAEVNRLNHSPEYKGVCATHDFCDANQAMIDSLDTFGLEFEHDLIELINASWEIAKQNGFVPQMCDRI